MCKKNQQKFETKIDFKKQTPKQQIKVVKQSELYKKAWLEDKDDTSNEYCMNTTTWD